MRTRIIGNRTCHWILSAIALTVLVTGGVFAQQEDVAKLVERGEQSYLAYCGSCHGEDATGNGLIAPYLKSAVPDLTQINARWQGEFPFDAMYDIVDGRDVPGHGTRAMPVWGPAFLGMADEPDKKVVKEKVIELVYYLKSIQPAMATTPVKMGGSE